MSKFKINLFTASMLLATTFIFSCSSSDDNSNDYKTVKIGTQIWFAENLNRNVPGSKCYDNQTSNCATYGRLYDWSTAMKLPSSCNENDCYDLINTPHQGICPDGWHIPSNEEWGRLYSYVDGKESSYYSSTAGKYLKAASGWNSNGNGIDAYGFSALPGGFGGSDGSFSFVGYYGGWWSTDYYSYRSMYYEDEGAYWGSGDRSYLFSVRCVKDCDEKSSPCVPPSSSSIAIVPSSSSSVPSSNGYTGSYGSLPYEGQTYKTVVIGTQTWMAENLNYVVEGSKCYDNDPANCNTYGSLYDWATAMSLPSSCNFSSCSDQINNPHRGICPSGWHIPSDAEWTTLANFVVDFVGFNAGTKLKARSGWNDYYEASGNGTDEFGFSALPGGVGDSGGYFYDVGYYGYWWSATEYDAYNAYGRGMYYDNDYVFSYSFYGKSGLFSVRCLQD